VEGGEDGGRDDSIAFGLGAAVTDTVKRVGALGFRFGFVCGTGDARYSSVMSRRTLGCAFRSMSPLALVFFFGCTSLVVILLFETFLAAVSRIPLRVRGIVETRRPRNKRNVVDELRTVS
jgi:hypothetical protein